MNLFGNSKPLEFKFNSNPAGGSLFDSKNTLFGNTTSIFAKKTDDKKPEDGEESDGAYKPDNELPSLALEDQTA